MKQSIYLDHAATTPIHPAAAAKLISMLEQVFGNPSSIHSFGREARKALEDARDVLARSIGAEPQELIFTSGGTEANNMAIFGAVEAMKQRGRHIITTEIEHHAVLNPCKRLESQGYDVTFLPVDEQGRISVKELQEALRDDTILVSVMYGNNEVGTIQPIEEIGSLLADRDTLFHTDAVQAFGSCKLHVADLGVDLLSASAHKINGPKGIGFLYQRKGVLTQPLQLGGDQERKRRAGTENVPAAAAFAEAVRVAEHEREQTMEQYASYKAKMRSVFTQEGIEFVPTVADSTESLPHIFHLSFPGTDVESLLVNLDLEGVAVSSGSACTAGSMEPSHVLTSMFGKGAPCERNSIRISFGYGLSEELIEEAARRIANVVNRLTN